MEKKLFVTPEYTTAKEIKRVRTKLGLTQKEFALLINASKPTVERWERSQEPITGPIVLLIKMLGDYPECFDKLRRGQVNLHYEDISLKFAELGISFDDIAQVRVHQDMKSFTLDDMFKARVANQDIDVSLNTRR